MKKSKNEVIPSPELLNEMELLEIHGGIGGNVYNADDYNENCGGAFCKCVIPDPGTKPNGTQTCNSNCGAGTQCIK